jgi:anti-sigma regulatory factor (Ser/Thr protein kinase)
MRCKIASLEQMGAAVVSLTKYAELSTPMTEETKYYLKVVLSELITNSFKYGGGQENQVRAEVDVKGGSLVVTVDDGGRGIDSTSLGGCADIYSEGGRGLAIVKGLCQSVQLNPAGNRVTASLSIQQ